MPSAAQNSAKQEELIEIASKLFYEQGYGMTGIKQIIDAAGIAKGTFYSHFPSKEALGLAWLRDRHHRWNQWLAADIDALDSPQDKLLGVFDFLVHWMKESDYRGCAFLNTCAETPDCSSPLRDEVSAHKRGLHDKFQELAIQHFHLDDPSGDPIPAARHKGTILYLLFEGALTEARNFHDPWPIMAARTEAASILSQSLSSTTL